MRQLNQLLRGLGLVPNGKRSVTPIPQNLLALVPKPDGKNEVVKSSNADPEKDTVPMLIRNVRRQKWQGAKLAQKLKGATRGETVKNIYDFFFNHIQYVEDAKGEETVRSLRRLVWEKRGDCDCYTSGISNLLLNLNIPFSFRISKYDGSSDYSHIYIVVPKSGNSLSNGYYTIDPVVHQFNYEVPKSDFRDFPMMLKSLDGVGSACVTSSPIKKSNLVSAQELYEQGKQSVSELLMVNSYDYTKKGDSYEVNTPFGKRLVSTIIPIEQKQSFLQSLKEPLPIQSENPSTDTVTDPSIKVEDKKKLNLWGWGTLATIVGLVLYQPKSLGALPKRVSIPLVRV